MSEMHVILIRDLKRRWRYFRPVGRDKFFWSKYQRDDSTEDTYVNPSRQPEVATGDCLWSKSDLVPPGGYGIRCYNLKWGYMGKRERQSKTAYKRNPIWHPYLKMETQASIASGGPYFAPNSLGQILKVVGANDDSIISAFLPSYEDVEVSPGVFEVSLSLGIFGPEYRNKIRDALRRQYSVNFHKMVNKDQVVDLGSTIVEIAEMKRLFFKGAPQIRELLASFGKAMVGNPVQVYKQLKLFAGSWLEYSYGIKPMIDTIYGLAQELPKKFEMLSLDHRIMRTTRLANSTPFTLQVYQKAQRRIVGLTEPVPGSHCGVPDGTEQEGGNYLRVSIDDEVVYEIGDPSCSADTWSRGTIEVRQSGIYKARQDWSRFLFAVGLQDIRPALWEAIPFSFVLDWYYKVGTFLTSQTDLQGLDVYEGCLSTEWRYLIETSDGSNGIGKVLIRDVVKTDGSVFDSDINFMYDDALRELVPAPVIQAGTMVSKMDKRSANAGALLVLLLPVLAQVTGLRNLAGLLPKSALKKFSTVLVLLTGIPLAMDVPVLPPHDGDPE